MKKSIQNNVGRWIRANFYRRPVEAKILKSEGEACTIRFKADDGKTIQRKVHHKWLTNVKVLSR